MEQNRCKGGVTLIRDGCDCCYICARQQGDLCDIKEKCDSAKGLYCDMKIDGGKYGICRAKAAKMCELDGIKYKDGEEFKINCSRLCSCQNGQIACSSECPQEDRMPSSVHCKDPQLVHIEGRCCREWACPHSHSMPPQEMDGGLAGLGTHLNFPSDWPQVPPKRRDCEVHESDWSPCSVTCGMGVSIRQSNNNTDCKPVNEQRLCLIRPCVQEEDNKAGVECKSTWKSDKVKALKWGNCTSMTNFKLKYCSTCKKHKCCGPGKTKDVFVDFDCEGKRITERFMWIRNCECVRQRTCPYRL
ncbi:hypothetical protein CAPTEDRAFT_165049 [Capitella teleta]|uniref:CTCK domain-containing protein n=1 Tax=Capitella teleta TaxID=283909 RepID=R7TK54_CAPTE|nr:hypothetical protein CAPTEDRAFT_165049 [Capitella teleta]|eukprot:ELT91911.1 hypothetical protein CAPTEDRAFT_165049 [Capitella teleta]